MQVNFIVTESDIQNGKQSDNKQCPVALAISRRINRFKGVKVDYSSASPASVLCRFTYRGRFYWSQSTPPQSVYDFIQTFDRDGQRSSAKPFRFSVEMSQLDMLKEECHD